MVRGFWGVLVWVATDGVHVEEIASAFDGIVDPVIAVLLVDLVILQGHLVPGLGGFVARRKGGGRLKEGMGNGGIFDNKCMKEFGKENDSLQGDAEDVSLSIPNCSNFNRTKNGASSGE